MNIIVDQHKIGRGKYGDTFLFMATVCGLIIADTDSGLIACHLGASDTELNEYDEFCEMISKIQIRRIFIFTQAIPSEEESFYKSSAIKISEKCIHTYFYTTKNSSNMMIAIQFNSDGTIPNLMSCFNKFDYQ